MNNTTLNSSNGGVIYIAGGSTNINNSLIAVGYKGGEIRISRGLTTENCKIEAREGNRIHIGEDCMFSFGINIATTDYHSILSASTGERINPGKDIRIGNHVWLGRNVDIMKGVSIADNIIVGAGSIVTKSLTNSNSIYVGHPAAEIKTDVTWVRPLI